MAVWQMRRMPNTEFERWKVYYQLKAQREELATKKAKGQR